MRTTLGILLVTATAAACGKPTAKKAGGADSVSMADMPGMPGMKTPGGGAMREDSVTPVPGAPAPLPPTIIFTAQQVQHGGVRWTSIAMGTASATAVVPGTLVPNEDRTARLGAPAGGRVIDVRVQPGDRVEQGRVLVTLQSAAAGMAQSDVAKSVAEVTARRAQAEYAAAARARAERLLALKAIPRQDYERAIADDEQARASLVQADAELRRAQSAAEQLGATATATGEIALRAPRAGLRQAVATDPAAWRSYGSIGSRVRGYRRRKTRRGSVVWPLNTCFLCRGRFGSALFSPWPALWDIGAPIAAHFCSCSRPSL